MAKDILADISNAKDHIKQIQTQLESQTCNTIREQVSAAAAEVEILQQHICNVRDDLHSVSNIYEETEEDITGKIRSLGGINAVLEMISAIEPTDTGKIHIPMKTIGPDTQNLIRMIHTAHEDIFRNWHKNTYFLIPGGNLIIDDWIKPLIVEAYLHERI